jgi:hypothetical protein
MRILRGALTVVGLAGAATALVVGPASASAPWYNTQYGNGYVDHCDSHTSGGSNGQNGGEFIATTFSGVGCQESAVEFVFVDNWGNELAWHQTNTRFDNGWVAQIIVSNTDFTRAIEVVGSSISVQDDQTPGQYLYY